jgi:transcription termination/antitermination protein NusG
MSLKNSDSNWYALYVKSRFEFVTEGELVKKGIEAYLPTVNRLRRWKDRNKLVNFPLFPGYLFIHIVPRAEEFGKVYATRGVVNVLGSSHGDPIAVSPEEITSLQLLVGSGMDLDVYPHLKEGTKVRFTRGPLQGAGGILQKVEGRYIFVVNIELLGRCVAVKVHANDVEPV